MNVTTNSSGMTPLKDIVPDSSIVAGLLLEHNDVPVPGEIEEIEEIHVRAETMTSLLKGILDLHPAPHWGINE
jgi:hypothetical protein